MPKVKKEKVLKTKKEKIVSENNEEPKYIVEFSYNGQKEILKGNDLIQLFENWSPRVFKTVVLLNATNGRQTIERRLSVTQARRISQNYTNAQIFANNIYKFLNA